MQNNTHICDFFAFPNINKKSELMLMIRARAYSSSIHFVAIHCFAAKNH